MFSLIVPSFFKLKIIEKMGDSLVSVAKRSELINEQKTLRRSGGRRKDVKQMNIVKDGYRLVTHFTKEEAEWLKAHYPSSKSNAYFQYSYFQRKPNFFSLLMYPKIPMYGDTTTLCCHLIRLAPPQALEIFNMISPERWAVKRLDIAIDYPLPLHAFYYRRQQAKESKG
ncbi:MULTISPECIES: hypothetical protein [unclassified Paenibacillus]|uniref:hypothetical protein n=1 Tax=unclassified Paenibacillus TaxID=185978 RepID=UPI0036D376EC